MSPHPTPPEAPSAAQDLTRARILIVEDNFVIANDLRNILQSFNYNVTGIAHSMPTALAALHRHPVDMVLIDVNLQEQRDGIDLAREIRLHYSLPFIYITSYVDEATLSRANLTQPYGYVVKPFMEADIKAAVEVALYRHAYEQVSRQEQERRLLLDMSMALATVRERATLLRLLFEKSQPVFGFHDVGLFVLSPDGQHIADWTTVDPTISPSVGNEKFHQLPPQQFAYPDSSFSVLVDRLTHAGQPVVVPYDDAYLALTDDPDLQAHCARIIAAGGYREFLGTLLRTGGQVLGYLCFNSLQTGYFQPAQFELFQAVADQVAGAVANVLAREEIMAREQEKDVLLHVAQTIATVNDKKTLLTAIFGLLRPLVEFEDLGLAVFDADDQHLVDWATVWPEVYESLVNNILHEREQERLPYPGTLLEHTYSQIEGAGSPLILPITEELARQWPDAVYLPVEIEQGFQECLMTTLKTGGRLLGSLNLNSKRAGYFATIDLKLFQAIADQVAVAVANILANEEILEREREKTVLLDISEAVATIADRSALLRVVFDKLKPLFGFYDTGFFVLDEAQEYIQDLTVTDPSICPSATVDRLHKEEAGVLKYAGSALEWVVQELQQADGPVLFRYDEELFARFPDYVQLPALRADGYQESLSTLLRTGDRLLGILFFNSTQAGHFRPAQYRLFQNVSNQLAVAVANILATEEITERERVKATLLEISETLAEARIHRELLQVIFDQIRTVLPFADAGLFEIRPDGAHRDLTVDNDLDGMPSGMAIGQAGLYGFLPAHPAVDEFLHEPRIRSLAWVLEHCPGHPHFPYLIDAGLREILGGPLVHNGHRMGMLCLWGREEGTFHARQLPLFKQLLSLFATTMANILANEEIIEREREKTLQLTVTTALTSSEAWATKFLTVAEEIGWLAGWDVCRFVFPQRSSLDLSWRRTDTEGVERLYPQMVVRELGVAPLELRELMQAMTPLHEHPALYGGADMERLVQQYGLLKLTQEKWGVQSKLFLPVRHHDELVAVLILDSRQPSFYQPAQLAVLERLAPQLALGLENLFSFEKIERQERERTRQLALSNALVTMKSSFSLYQAVAEELNPLVPLDSLSAWTFTAQQLLHFTVVRKDDKGMFADITDASRAAYSDMDMQETEALMQRELRPAVYTGEAFEAMCAQHLVYRVRRDVFQVASTLELPLPVRNGLRSVLVLSSRAAFAFTDDDLRQVLPFAPQIALAVENMVAHEELNQLRKRAELEKVYLAEEVKSTYNFEEMVGVSSSLQQVFRQVSQVASTDATVLITGETGTGKELIARALHSQSPRRGHTLIKLNCAALPAQLIESELFGHEKGAFTGAVEKRVGKFELAQGSTIFLDEVGELPLELQSKLLRVLQEREFERVGGNKVFKADVRVVAATNRHLADEVAAGRFRADLYYRLSVFPIQMPALRERPEDIPLLAQHFARKFSRTLGKPYYGIQEAALQELLAYDWPGNIRELENLVEQAVIVCPGPLEWARILRPTAPMAAYSPPSPAGSVAAGTSLREERDELERNRILAALAQTQGRIRGPRGAAQALGMKPTTLESKMEKLGIRKEPRYVAGTSSPPPAESLTH
ncbi:sigma 54-interacting transcriptional regulator [Hymenobacter terrenus]|uniref:sigma 54-interacting transcriptional regulator n=1 Tax=Hymenobacter terrenus TaxID=1629124 RepID=UPI0006976776|nr:sigma 54-interacting transcriptional regulator [Hymenobacter terrenus]